MSTSASIPSFSDIMKSPEFTGEEVLDQKAFQIRTVIKSGKHGKVALCESADDDSEVTEVAIKSELIKSPQNPNSRPYREYLILKQLGSLLRRPEFYANPRWVGFIQILDWFKAKTDQVRVTSTPASPVKTPTKVAVAVSATKSAARGCLSTGMKTGPRMMESARKISYQDENEDVGALTNSVSALGLTPSKRGVRATPKRIVPRTPMLQANESRHREIKLQEGNLILEKADTTLSAVRSDLSFEVWRDVLFQILYALYVGQSQFEFMHRDLHLQNVLLKRLKIVPSKRVAPHSDSGYVSVSSDDDTVDAETLVDKNCGVFQDGERKWYSRGPWIVKLSDFGLSRITMVDGDGSVIYDVAQPLAEAFLGDRDVLQVVDEFSRVKILRWLSFGECASLGVNVSVLKDSCFVGPEKAISLEDILSTLQTEEVVVKVNEAIAAKQKAVKAVRHAIRKSALHLRTLLHHEFFAPLVRKPDCLWLFDGDMMEFQSSLKTTKEVSAQRTPSHALLSSSSSSSSPDSPPLPVKKLAFDDNTMREETVPEMTSHMEHASPASPSSPFYSSASHVPPTTPSHGMASSASSTTSTIDTTPMRRSARVAAQRSVERPKSALKPAILVKPDPSAMVTHRHSSSSTREQHVDNSAVPLTFKEEAEEEEEIHTKLTTSAHRRDRRHTILPSELDAVLPDAIGAVNKSLASLFIDSSSSSSHVSPVESAVEVVVYAPVPARCLGSPMALPMSEHAPVNCVEALRDYLVRRAAKLEETRPKRSQGPLQRFFVRSEAQMAEARVLRLEKKRRRARPLGRRSLGGVRSAASANDGVGGVGVGVGVSTRSSVRRKSMSGDAMAGVQQRVAAEEGGVCVVVSNFPSSSVSEFGDSSAYTSDSELTAQAKVSKKARSSVLEANGLGLITSPTVPRRSSRRSSLSASPLSEVVVPSFAAPVSYSHHPISTTSGSSSKSTSSVALSRSNKAAQRSRAEESSNGPSTVTTKSAKSSPRPPTPIKVPASHASKGASVTRVCMNTASGSVSSSDQIATSRRTR